MTNTPDLSPAALDAFEERLARITSPAAVSRLLNEALSYVRALRAQVNEWQDEVARFNRGWERRAEPYSALEDEFEQMGWAWANVDRLGKLALDLSQARRERDEARAEMLRNLRFIRDRYTLGTVQHRTMSGAVAELERAPDAARAALAAERGKKPKQASSGE